jgi:glycosyltransferase involved in cell wall biosynthesis
MNKIADMALAAARSKRALRVTMLGIRGFPDVQGGVEKHAEKLSCALAELGCRVEAIVRSPFVAKERGTTWRDIKLVRLWAPRTAGLEAFVHTFLGVLRAGFVRPNILHIHAIGPAIFAPLARVLGLRVVVTYHSLNYEHEKWGRVARAMLRLGEWAGMVFANGRIVVSRALAKHMLRNHKVSASVIPNGIDRPVIVQSIEFLRCCGLSANRYALTVARIDATKRQLDLITAYTRLRAPTWQLALVGGADHSSGYAQAVAAAAAKTPGVVMLGHRSGAELAELYSHAGVFVLPSSHEGQPIVVLEAVSFGLPVILSDIPAHREFGLANARYFTVGDIAGLAEHLAATFATPIVAKSDPTEQTRILGAHDWRSIAQRTLAVYVDALSATGSGCAAADAPTRNGREPSSP